MKKTETAAAKGAGHVYLAPLSPSFAQSLFELLNDWDVVRMLSEVPWPLRYEDVETFLSSEHTDTDDFVILCNVGAKAQGPVGNEVFHAIGVCGVKRPGTSAPPRKMPRLGYWIGRPHWGRGFGTEAVAELVDRAFRMFPHDRVGAGVFMENAASQRVLAKLGFTVKGSKMVTSRSRGGEVEAIDMQITRYEWEAAKARRQ